MESECFTCKKKHTCQNCVLTHTSDAIFYCEDKKPNYRYKDDKLKYLLPDKILTKKQIKKALRILKRDRFLEILTHKDTTTTDNLIREIENYSNSV